MMEPVLRPTKEVDMTRALAGTVLAIVAVGVAAADDPKDRDEGKAVVAKLEGKWGLNAFTSDGKTTSWGNTTVYVFRANQVMRENASGKEVDLGTYVIWDWAGLIDLTFGPNGTFKGIYKIEGDTLAVCYGRERPTKFESKP